MSIEITRKLEFDAGHRIPNHASKCRNLHGHRYVLECTVTGKIVTTWGASDEGMLIDFGMLKWIMNNVIVEPWDHALLLWDKDPLLDSGEYPYGYHLLKVLPEDHKTVLLPCIPTAENLAAFAFAALATPLLQHGLQLTHVRLYETPNCWADYYATSTTEE